jgi:hypothetical protein
MDQRCATNSQPLSKAQAHPLSAGYGCSGHSTRVTVGAAYTEVDIAVKARQVASRFWIFMLM